MKNKILSASGGRPARRKRFPLRCVCNGAAMLLAVSAIIAQTGCARRTGSTQEPGRTGAGADAANEPVSRESFYFDTICMISVYGMEDADGMDADAWEESAGGAIADAFALCSEYEQLLSKTVEGSDVWNINHAEGQPVSCDARTLELIQKGMSYGGLSDGAFDITIGKAEDLWDFHSEEAKVPGKEELAEAVSHVDYTQIRVDEDAGTVQLTDPEAEIDLGGIAKGYIADAVSEGLREDGVVSAVISLGGNIVCIGEKTEGTPFRIGIETPYSDRTEIVGTAEGTDATFVTSGVYERYFTVDGQEYHHILDPETGYPAQTDVLGVTIEGTLGTSADCDALSTICLALGSEKGRELVESLDGFEAVFILRDESIVVTSGADFTPS